MLSKCCNATSPDTDLFKNKSEVATFIRSDQTVFCPTWFNHFSWMSLQQTKQSGIIIIVNPALLVCIAFVVDVQPAYCCKKIITSLHTIFLWCHSLASDVCQHASTSGQSDIVISTSSSSFTKSSFEIHLGTLLLHVTWASRASMVASAGETDRDLAGRQFPRNCLP